MSRTRQRPSWRLALRHAQTQREALLEAAPRGSLTGIARVDLWATALVLAPALLVLGQGIHSGPVLGTLAALWAVVLSVLLPSHTATRSERLPPDPPVPALPVDAASRCGGEALASWWSLARPVALMLLPLLFLGPMLASSTGVGVPGRVMEWCARQPGLATPWGVLTSVALGLLALLPLALNATRPTAGCLTKLADVLLPPLTLGWAPVLLDESPRLAVLGASLALGAWWLRPAPATRAAPTRVRLPTGGRGLLSRSRRGLPAEWRLVLDTAREAVRNGLSVMATIAVGLLAFAATLAWWLWSLPVETKRFGFAYRMIADSPGPVERFHESLLPLILCMIFVGRGLGWMQVDSASAVAERLEPSLRKSWGESRLAWQRLPLSAEHLAFASALHALLVGLLFGGAVSVAQLLPGQGHRDGLLVGWVLGQVAVGTLAAAGFESWMHRRSAGWAFLAFVLGLSGVVYFATGWSADVSLGMIVGAGLFVAAWALLLGHRVPLALLRRRPWVPAVADHAGSSG